MNKISQAIKVLNEGGIIIYPTDTAYGIGCRIDKPKSIMRLFKLRRRPEDQAMPVLVDSIEMACNYFKKSIPTDIKNLIRTHWPGALTVIYYCEKDKVPTLVRGNGETLGIRMPDNKVTLSIIKGVEVPLLGSSANFHGGKTPYVFEDLDQDLVKSVDYVIEGNCKKKEVSTVVDCSIKPYKIIRQGNLHLEL
jgi:L-threonylcarbamoyladenylate synthase